MTTAQVDKKGRVTLGSRFAGKTVLIEEVGESSVKVTAAIVIPEDEAWLYRNPKALTSVRLGLRQVRAKKFAKGPDLAADAKLVKKLKD